MNDEEKELAPLVVKALVIEARHRSLSGLIKWGALCFIFYHIAQVLITFAGKETQANIVIDLLGRAFWGYPIMTVFGIFGIIYGFWQRKLRKDAVEMLSKHIQFLETELDPNRSSGKLTPRGDTREEDK